MPLDSGRTIFLLVELIDLLELVFADGPRVRLVQLEQRRTVDLVATEGPEHARVVHLLLVGIE